MIKKIIFTILTLQTFLLAQFQGANSSQMLELHRHGAVIVDIRRVAEWKETGVIPGSTKITFFDEQGGYDIEKFMSELKKVVKDKNQPIILVCRTANRTKTVGNFLSTDMGYKNVKELSGGITFGWINEGKKTIK